MSIYSFCVDDTVTQLTEDIYALREVMRLRGFSVMTNVLEDYATDVEICVLVRFSLAHVTHL
jgi:hypothetical protein